jgi:hypothetical protein
MKTYNSLKKSIFGLVFSVFALFNISAQLQFTVQPNSLQVWSDKPVSIYVHAQTNSGENATNYDFQVNHPSYGWTSLGSSSSGSFSFIPQDYGATSGTFQAKVIASGNGGPVTSSIFTISVFGPAPTISIPQSLQGPANLTATVTNLPDNSEVVWYANGTQIGVGNPFYFDNGGVRNVTLTVYAVIRDKTYLTVQAQSGACAVFF